VLTAAEEVGFDYFETVMRVARSAVMMTRGVKSARDSMKRHFLKVLFQEFAL
jgi:hypothetical protein